MHNDSYSKLVWKQFAKNRIGILALFVFSLFVLVGIYAPFFASSKPFYVSYQGKSYFPLFRYLFYTGFYTKKIDLFYNVLIFIFPIALMGIFLLKGQIRKWFVLGIIVLQCIIFLVLSTGIVKDPASNPQLQIARKEALDKRQFLQKDSLLAPLTTQPDWNFELKYMSDYEKLNLLLRYRARKIQNEKLEPYAKKYEQTYGTTMPTLWNIDRANETKEKNRLEKQMKKLQTQYDQAKEEYPALMDRYRKNTKEEELKTQLSHTKDILQEYRDLKAKLYFVEEKQQWLKKEGNQLKNVVMPIIPFHWEDDAGGEQAINRFVPFWDLTRINRKDLTSALIFGVRISLVVGIVAVLISLTIGIPIGTYAGYHAGTADIVISRFIEIWESMPVFFMLLLIVAITQSKSIFLVIATLGVFGWTSFSRFMRAEVLKQRNLSYVLSCHNLGFSHSRIMFSHILPNAIPPILTLLPFAMMGAITSEAALSFLGLGEEGSSSWGVLMDEGRSVFPGESYLLWPPAILLTILLISIALVGDALRDAIDPKLRT